MRHGVFRWRGFFDSQKVLASQTRAALCWRQRQQLLQRPLRIVVFTAPAIFGSRFANGIQRMERSKKSCSINILSEEHLPKVPPPRTGQESRKQFRRFRKCNSTCLDAKQNPSKRGTLAGVSERVAWGKSDLPFNVIGGVRHARPWTLTIQLPSSDTAALSCYWCQEQWRSL